MYHTGPPLCTVANKPRQRRHSRHSPTAGAVRTRVRTQQQGTSIRSEQNPFRSLTCLLTSTQNLQTQVEQLLHLLQGESSKLLFYECKDRVDVTGTWQFFLTQVTHPARRIVLRDTQSVSHDHQTDFNIGSHPGHRAILRSLVTGPQCCFSLMCAST